MIEFMIGSDPEMFVRRDNTIGSVAGLLGCTKWNKRTLPQGINLQEDNVLVEFDIPPCANYAEFDRMIQAGIDHSRDAVSALGFDIAEGVASHVFSAEELKAFPEDAFVFGCEPDFNAVTGSQNLRPESVNPGLRTAGGHVHLGVAGLYDVNPLSQRHTGILCDYFLGLPSLLIDFDDRRRELYGTASAVRFKPYGVEYRTLSNYWIFKPDTRKMVYDQTSKVVEAMLNKELMRYAGSFDPMVVANTIDTADRRMAEQICRQLGII